MSVNDGFGILVAFSVIGGIILGEIRWRQIKNKPVVEEPKRRTKKAKRVRKRKEKDDTSEFESDDIDRDVDESPDDSLIYDLFN